MNTSRLGRYEVVGTLAHGGMAEILLGRLSGPSGFERLVVIKRILPNYARLSEFRDMFLDEARIAASIRQDNVVQHHELVERDGELFLVMEYLEGEVLSGFRRRARSHHVRIQPAVAAHIVAEACAGLHAAHELVTPDGVAQEVVHRDVSPHNIFVTYDGAIKVIDFGIAKAARRITKTEAGQLKGKFSYMSPEQAAGDELDRRSDIYALGIVLFELLSGKQLFRRATHTSTLKAVLAGQIPSLRKISPTCPEALCAITKRALAKERKERYATALEMRRALIQSIRDLAPENLPRDTLTALMEDLFRDRRIDKRRMLKRAVEEHGSIENIPPSEVDLDVEIPQVEPDSMLPLPHDSQSAPSQRPSAQWITAFVIVVIVLIGSGGAFILAGRGERLSPPPSVEARAPSKAPFDSAPLTRPPAVEPGEISLRFETEPPGAVLEIDGETKGTTPTTIRMPKSGENIQATLSLDHHEPRLISLKLTTNQRLHYSLERLPQTPEIEPRHNPRSPNRGARRSGANDGHSPTSSDWSKMRF